MHVPHLSAAVPLSSEDVTIPAEQVEINPGYYLTSFTSYILPFGEAIVSVAFD
jgi:hypothetical protein